MFLPSLSWQSDRFDMNCCFTKREAVLFLSYVPPAASDRVLCGERVHAIQGDAAVADILGRDCSE